MDFCLWCFSSLFKMEETGICGVSITFLWFISLGSNTQKEGQNGVSFSSTQLTHSSWKSTPFNLFSWLHPIQFSCSVTSHSATPWTAARQASLSITNSQSLIKLMSIELVMLPNHLILCHPLLLLPSIFPSIRVFSNESVLHFRWPKYWSFSFNNSLFNEYLWLISFRMDWLDLLAVQETLKSLL